MASLASSRNEAFQVPGSPSNLALLEEVDHRIYIYDLNTRGTVGQQAGLPNTYCPTSRTPRARIA